MANIANPLPYLNKREYGLLPDIKSQLFSNRLSAAKNLYRRDLVCHFGCVNAVEFSSNGELLVSGEAANYCYGVNTTCIMNACKFCCRYLTTSSFSQ